MFSAVFVFQKSYSGNILGIGRNENPGPYYFVTYPESEGEMKTGTEPATPCGGVAPPSSAPPRGEGPSGAH